MDNSIFKNEVNYWDAYFDGSKNFDNKIFELAFFKIFVKFELYVSEIFIHYCIGNSSIHQFSQNRRLNFLDMKHFDSIVKNSSNQNYIDYFSKMLDLAPHIFEENNTPFIVFSDPNYNQAISQMRILRNYIAHESLSAKEKYCKNLNNNKFIEPHEFLLKKRKGTEITNYTHYITSLVEISEFLLNPIPD